MRLPLRRRVIFKWLRHAADPKRKDFARTVATSRDKPFRGASRSLWKPLARPLGRLLDRSGRLVGGLWSILGRLGGFVGGGEALYPDSDRFCENLGPVLDPKKHDF